MSKNLRGVSADRTLYNHHMHADTVHPKTNGNLGDYIAKIFRVLLYLLLDTRSSKAQTPTPQMAVSWQVFSAPPSEPLFVVDVHPRASTRCNDAVVDFTYPTSSSE